MKRHGFVFEANAEISEIAHGLEAWLKNDRGMEVQVFHLDQGRYALQAQRRRSESARLFGLDRAVCLYMEPIKNGRVRAVIGGSRWKDKAIAASVSLVSMWPLILTAVAGAAGQIAIAVQLQRRLKRYAREVKI